MLSHWILSLLIWVPIIGGLITLAVGMNDAHRTLIRWVALAFALITLFLCVPLYFEFDPNLYTMQLVEQHAWIPGLDIGYNLGVDGISVLFIMLNCFTTLIILLSAWSHTKEKAAQYMAIFLISAGLVNGAFATTDAILFYVFFESSLVPMFLGVGIWGGPRKVYASMKFFMMMFLGSIFMLLAFLYLHTKSGNFSIQDFQNVNLTAAEAGWIFMAFLATFAVKIPMWPVHTWLPDAHTEAPSGGSVILAALMLKLGAYGFVRFSLPIVPEVHQAFDWLLIGLSLIAIIYVGFACIMQTDMKRLIAYSSVSHMGLVTLGIFMVFRIVGETHGHNFAHDEDALIGLQGAIFQMVAHAFSAGAMFLGVGYMYDRYGSRLIKDYKGLAHAMPIFAAFYMLFAMANVGLPGTAGFVGEFMIVLAAFKANVWIAILAAFTLVLAPAYTLWMYKRVLFGEIKGRKFAEKNDLKANEILVFVLLAIPTIIFGLYPQWILHISHAASAHFLVHVMSRIPAGSY